jgi:hypothetical protein
MEATREYLTSIGRSLRATIFQSRIHSLTILVQSRIRSFTDEET